MNLLVIITLQRRIIQGPGGIGICSRCEVDGLPLKKPDKHEFESKTFKTKFTSYRVLEGVAVQRFPEKKCKKKTN